LDDPSITDGTDVLVVTREREEAVRLSPEELAELEAGIAEADRGETISGEELFACLRRHEYRWRLSYMSRITPS
jgi:predicted transcriptional regulator